jgi:hypothetical protein
MGSGIGHSHCRICVAGEANERHSEIRKFREWTTKSLKLHPLVAKLSGLNPRNSATFAVLPCSETSTFRFPRLPFALSFPFSVRCRLFSSGARRLRPTPTSFSGSLPSKRECAQCKRETNFHFNHFTPEPRVKITQYNEYQFDKLWYCDPLDKYFTMIYNGEFKEIVVSAKGYKGSKKTTVRYPIL